MTEAQVFDRFVLCGKRDYCPDTFVVTRSGGELGPAEQRTLYRGPGESDWLFWNRTLGVSRSMRLRFEDRDFALLMGGTIVADYDGSSEFRDDDLMNARFTLLHRMTYGKTPTKRIRAALGLADFIGMTPKDFA